MKQQYNHTEDLVDHYWGSINYVAGMIKASEIKAGLILTFYGIVLNLIYISVGSKVEPLMKDLPLCFMIFTWLAFMGVSIFFCVKCFMPILIKEYEKNIFFFGDVISAFGEIKDFSKLFYQISNNKDELFDQLGQQIYVNSKIASVKFRYVNRAILFMAISLFALLIMSLYGVFVLKAI